MKKGAAMMRAMWAMPVIAILCFGSTDLPAGEHPLTFERRADMQKRFNMDIAEATGEITADPKNVRAYSRRGDAHFFRADFERAVADYEKMVELDHTREASHWRRGIAYFYADRYKDGAHQFEIYNTFDNVDRENGIWRFFCQARAYGIKKARDGLLKYKKDDREPFPDVYRLFAQQVTPGPILQSIRDADVDDAEREKRLFYAQLYVGLNHAIEGDAPAALKHLREAVGNNWGPNAGYGPRYMWHVGRLHYERLIAQEAEASAK